MGDSSILKDHGQDEIFQDAFKLIATSAFPSYFEEFKLAQREVIKAQNKTKSIKAKISRLMSKGSN